MDKGEQLSKGDQGRKLDYLLQECHLGILKPLKFICNSLIVCQEESPGNFSSPPDFFFLFFFFFNSATIAKCVQANEMQDNCSSPHLGN